MCIKSLVSVIIPVYNTEQYLNKCVDSVINQSYKNLEIWLVDDGSTDSSLKICNEYEKQDSRIKVIHKDNGGLSSARNLALDSMHGEYVAFIDSDDWVSENWIESLYNSIKMNDSLISVGGICSCSQIRDVYSPIIHNEKYTTPESSMIKYITESDIRSVVCNKLYHYSLFDNLRFPVGRIYEDAYVIPELICRSNRICYSKEGYYFVRIREGSITHQSFSEKNLDLLYASDNMLRCCKENYPQLEKLAMAHKINEIDSLLKQLFIRGSDAFSDIEQKLNVALTEATEKYKSIDGEMYGYSISNDIDLYLTDRTKYIKKCKRNRYANIIRKCLINIISIIKNKDN